MALAVTRTLAVPRTWGQGATHSTSWTPPCPSLAPGKGTLLHDLPPSLRNEPQAAGAPGAVGVLQLGRRASRRPRCSGHTCAAPGGVWGRGAGTRVGPLLPAHLARLGDQRFPRVWDCGSVFLPEAAPSVLAPHGHCVAPERFAGTSACHSACILLLSHRSPRTWREGATGGVDTRLWAPGHPNACLPHLSGACHRRCPKAPRTGPRGWGGPAPAAALATPARTSAASTAQPLRPARRALGALTAPPPLPRTSSPPDPPLPGAHVDVSVQQQSVNVREATPDSKDKFMSPVPVRGCNAVPEE